MFPQCPTPIAAVCLAIAFGAAPSASANQATITLDNDFFAGFDRHYTNGLQLAILARTDALPGAVRNLQPFGSDVDPRFTFAIGQRIYTPANTDTESPDRADRPYAGWLYALAEFRARRGEALEHFMASLGVVGPASGARRVQSAVHRVLDEPDSRGWGSQLHNQATVLLAYERAWPAAVATSAAALQADFTPRAGVSLGNAMTYANAGAILRVGRNLPDDFPATHISLGPPRDGYRGSYSTQGWYGWAGTDARYVARNIFLDGVDRKRFVWDLQAGMVVAWGFQRFGFALVRRSAEFAGQAKSDKFGQLTYSFIY